MKRNALLHTVLALTAACLLTGCAADEITQPAACTSFCLGMEQQTRAAQALNPQAFPTRLYLYREETDGAGRKFYAYHRELEVKSSHITLDNLTPQASYKAVFLSIPQGQTPALPTFSTTAPGYEEAVADYLALPADGASVATGNEVFRSIVSFTASTATGEQNAVLTRQNGALEVRVRNMGNICEAELCVMGRTAFLLHDGTGGQVITQGQPVGMTKRMTYSQYPSELRLRINLLPEEDVTDTKGTTNYLRLVTAVLNAQDGSVTKTEHKYPIRSAHSTIPIYPNQVTWLTLGQSDGSSGGDFTVSFGDKGNINLDDGDWDGWNDNYQTK